MKFSLIPALLAASLFGGWAAQAAPALISQKPEKHVPADKSDRAGMNDPFLVACLNALSHGKLSQGVEACTLALIIDPKDPDALELRGYGFLLQHRFDKAEEDFRTAVEIRPDSPDDLAGLGQSLVGLNRFSEAVGYFSKAVNFYPTNAAYLNGLCWARAGTGKDLDIALSDCEKALLLVPNAPAPLNSRGLVELRQGRFFEAIDDYTASLKARGSQPSAHFGRGLAHLALHQSAAGVADILQARAADDEIDAMFIAMGILPKDCGAKPNTKCPAGFPPLQKGEWVIARWLMPR